MQSTAFKINKYILGVMAEAWDRGLAIGGMPPIKNLVPIDLLTLKITKSQDVSGRRKQL